MGRAGAGYIWDLRMTGFNPLKGASMKSLLGIVILSLGLSFQAQGSELAGLSDGEVVAKFKAAVKSYGVDVKTAVEKGLRDIQGFKRSSADWKACQSSNDGNACVAAINEIAGKAFQTRVESNVFLLQEQIKNGRKLALQEGMQIFKLSTALNLLDSRVSEKDQSVQRACGSALASQAPQGYYQFLACASQGALPRDSSKLSAAQAAKFVDKLESELNEQKVRVLKAERMLN